MFDLPPQDELSSEIGQQRESWLSDCREREYLIVGGGITSLTAGIYLQQERCSTLVITEADHLGGRLTWDYGPVPIYSPASELLEKLEFPIESEPPLWLDRNLLLSFLVSRLYNEGGTVLTGGYFDSKPVKRDQQFEVEFTLADRPEVFHGEELITTLGKFDHENRVEESETRLGKLVLNTIRRRDQTIQAGVQALPASERGSGVPLESALLLSGRKAAEIVLDERI
ncbi:MAG: NAD(P)-binding protein [bacterium]